MCSFKSIYFVIFVLNLYKTNAQISDKRLCVDPECNEPVSLARTLLRYSSPDERRLSFAPNVEAKIFSKEAGSVTDLWGAEIKGKRGYVPITHVREYKKLKTPTLLVDTELKQHPQVPKDANKEPVEPNKVQEPFEVVDGTTLYLGRQLIDGINPSSTESPALATALPVASNEVKHTTEAITELKEEESTENEPPGEKSVVESVLSKFSNWMTEEADSEELDDEEDDEDEDDEENEEEEEESFENNSTETKDQISKQDPSETLKNLDISTYNLELDESFKDMLKEGNVVKEQPLKQDVPPLPNSEQQSQVVINKAEIPSPDPNLTNENELKAKQQINEIPPLPNSGQQSQVVPENKVEIPSPDQKPATANEPEINIAPEVLIPKTKIANKVDFSPGASEVNIQTLEEKSANLVENKEVAIDKPESNPNIEVVTEPTLSEDEPLPILEDVTQIPTTETSVKYASLPQPTAEEAVKSEEKNPQVEPVVPPSTDTTPSVVNIKPKTEEPAAKIAASQTNDQTQKLEQKIPLEENKSPYTESVLLPSASPISAAKTEEPAAKIAEESQILNEQIQKESDLEIKFPPLLVPDEDITQQATATPEEKDDKEALEPEAVRRTAYVTGNQNLGKEEQKPVPAYSPPPHLGGLFNKAENLASNEYKEMINPPLNVEDPTAEGVKLDNGSAEGTPQEDAPASEENNASNTDYVADDETTNTSEEEIYMDDVILDKQDDNYNKEALNVEEPKEENNIDEGAGFFSSLLSLFGGSSDTSIPPPSEESVDVIEEHLWSSQYHEETASVGHCDAATENCNTSQEEVANQKGLLEEMTLNFNSDVLILLVTTAVSVILLLFGYLALDRNGREAPLVAKINKLERELLITLKENELLQEKSSTDALEFERVPHEAVEELTRKLAEAQLARRALEEKLIELEREAEDKAVLEEQIESLEKELETSTEVGMELNRIISEMLDPMNGSDKLKENVEQLQRQLLEQRDTINSVNETLHDKEEENQTLRVDLEKNKRKAVELQHKLDEMVEKVLRIEKEKDQQQSSLQNEIALYRQKYNEAVSKEELLNNDIQVFRVKLSEAQRQSELKSNEYQQLRESLDKVKSIKNDKEALRSLLDSTSMRAELQQLKSENTRYIEQLQQEQSIKLALEQRYQAIVDEVNVLKHQYEQADKEKVEVNSKLEVLNNYFKKREAELQEEVIKYKSIWDAKEGEATSTTERIKYMQEEIENYKGQNETLKQEIISQEIELKSQISMLEKKVHENWVTARQTERKLEDARQEAAQLRNRLTLRERAINEERIQNRLQSPVEQNGDLPLSPHPIDSPASPPLMYGGRDHITKSPPIPGLPPFLPPLPGAPFMPPPIHGMPPFMPPPPSMYPGDHRPPPLGRMSSPPLNSRYSPDTSAFSPYDRNSPSPPYDSEYGASPPPIRGYSPYNSRDDRRDYKRPPHARTNGRNMKGSMMSSGSDHSNDSLDKNRKQSKMV